MKLLLYSASAIMGIMFSAHTFAYTFTQKDTTLLNKIETVVQKISKEKLEPIEKKISLILTQPTTNQRKTYIFQRIHEIIIARLATFSELKIDFWWVFGRFWIDIQGYGIRVLVNDIKDNAKNAVLLVNVPQWLCIEHNNYFLPEDFTLYSKDNWKNRELYTTNLTTRSWVVFWDLLCNITHIKIILPKDVEFFNTYGIWFSFVYPEKQISRIPFCVTYTLSADNAQYTERTLCFQSDSETYTKWSGVIWKTIQQALADGNVIEK